MSRKEWALAFREEPFEAARESHRVSRPRFKINRLQAKDDAGAVAVCCNLASKDRGAVAWDVSPTGKPLYPYVCNFYDEVLETSRHRGSFAGRTAPTEILWPSWPASSPWVTAVGATRFLDDVVSNGTEAAVSAEDGFGSGGGFSWDFGVPSYQKAAVGQYLSTAPELPAAAYAKSGRGTPDVAALGAGYTLLVRGETLGGIGGTSASAPVFAAMVSRLNDARFAAGKPMMGFLNPFLYRNPRAFKDVTEGDDKVGRGGGAQAGFDCAAGWDPVTGLGTPKFKALLRAAMRS